MIIIDINCTYFTLVRQINVMLSMIKVPNCMAFIVIFSLFLYIIPHFIGFLQKHSMRVIYISLT